MSERGCCIMKPDQSDHYSDMKVVVIDDDMTVASAIKSSLKDLGFNVKAFKDPVEGLDWVFNNDTDIVISDICMPHCDGFEVLKRIKDVKPACDVIFVTAYGQMDMAIRALREGATDFFEKPFTSAALRPAMERTRRFRMLARQRDLLVDKVDTLNRELICGPDSDNIMIGKSKAIKKVTEKIMDVADSPVTVLILGESGTGKELVANAIFNASSRNKKPFSTLNCPSIPEDLFESEIFGHRRGSFTGAIENRIGCVASAEGGTLFLDEVGDLPLKSQAKILRLLEQKTYLPVGEHVDKKADVRIIAATNQGLEEKVKQKQFREDLYYRLNVCAITVPPLRERKEDIPLLALYFAFRFGYQMSKTIEGIDDDAMLTLSEYDFPGNVRELRNIIESSIIHCKGSTVLRKKDLPELNPAVAGVREEKSLSTRALTFSDLEKELYEEALARTRNNVSAAARLLGLSRGKLRRRLSDLGLSSGDQIDE